MAAWLGGVLCAASLAFMGVAALAPVVSQDLGMSREAVGLYAGLVWASALVASTTAGAVVSRWGAWAATRWCLVACAAGLLSVASGVPSMFWLGALLIGVGQGLEAPPASQLLSRHVPPPRQPLFFSLKQTGVQFGALIASLALPALAAVLGWQVALLAVAGVLAAIACGLGVPASRHVLPPVSRAAHSGLLRGIAGMLQLLRKQRDLRSLACVAGAFGATQVCMNSFLITWAMTARDASLATAGVIAATAQGAGLVGRPLWGWVASRVGRAVQVLRGLGLLMALSALWIGLLGAQSPDAMLWMVAAAFGLSASGWNGVFLSEVAARSTPGAVAEGTAAAMLPLYVGLIAGPLSFAILSRWTDMSSGFVLLAVIAATGTLCVPRYRAVEKV